MKKRYYTGQIHLVKSHYEFTILTILQGEFDQCSSHPFHLYQKIENGKNRYVEAQSAGWEMLHFPSHDQFGWLMLYLLSQRKLGQDKKGHIGLFYTPIYGVY